MVQVKRVKLAALLFGALAIRVASLSACNKPAETPKEVVPKQSAAAPVLSTSFSPIYGLIVPLRIEGRDYRFLLDTGFGYTVLDNHFASTITKPGNYQTATVFRSAIDRGISAADGEKLAKDRLRLWKAQPIEIGSHVVPDFYPWFGVDLSILAMAKKTAPIDGILGVEIFRQFSWVLDNRKKTLTIWQHPPANEHFAHCVPYRDGPPVTGPALYLRTGDQFIEFAIDTGAEGSSIDAETLKLLKQAKAAKLTGTRQSGSINGLETSSDYFVTGFSLDKQPIGGFEFSYVNGKKGSNLLGRDFLAKLDRYMFVPSTFEFCFDESHLAQDNPIEVRRLGVRLIDGKVTFAANTSKSFEEQDLRNGDVLIEVNGQPAYPASLDEISSALNTTAKGKLSLVIERDGQRRTVRI